MMMRSQERAKVPVNFHGSGSKEKLKSAFNNDEVNSEYMDNLESAAAQSIRRGSNYPKVPEPYNQ